MLGYFFIKQRFINYFKNNFYFDYGIKFISKKIIYNINIKLSFFFAEKYIIEYYTKYVFNYSALIINKNFFKINNNIYTYLLFILINTLILFL